MASYLCPFCRQPSDTTGVTCPNCGAPIDVTRSRDDSGWTELPVIPDMTRIQFGQASCQITGDQVPVAHLALSGSEQVYFCHHVILWSDAGVQLQPMPMKGAWNRTLSGMPLVMMTATGPGAIAFSQDHCGELVAIPLDDGQQVDVREHRFLVATTNVDYSWYSSNIEYSVRDGNDQKRCYPLGQFVDRFQSHGPGLLLLHVPGNVFLRDLAEGEALLVQGGSLVYKDASVGMQLHLEYPGGDSPALRGRPVKPWLRVGGPGRIATCSVFADGDFVYNLVTSTTATTANWR
jgi:uncharacterized protein (AIM24 family)